MIELSTVTRHLRQKLLRSAYSALPMGELQATRAGPVWVAARANVTQAADTMPRWLMLLPIDLVVLAILASSSQRLVKVRQAQMLAVIGVARDTWIGSWTG